MHRPVLITAPAISPITVSAVKAELPADASGDDDLIQALIDAAVSYLDGWTGILGRCLVEQTWRQDFDRFERALRLPLGPVISISSVKWRDRSGSLSDVAEEDYALYADAGGGFVRFANGFSYPGDLAEIAAVSVTFVAGYANIAGEPLASTVPAAIQQAIKFMVKKSWSIARQDLFKQSEEVDGIGSTRWSGMVEVSGAVDAAASALLEPFRIRRI